MRDFMPDGAGPVGPAALAEPERHVDLEVRAGTRRHDAAVEHGPVLVREREDLASDLPAPLRVDDAERAVPDGDGGDVPQFLKVTRGPERLVPAEVRRRL